MSARATSAPGAPLAAAVRTPRTGARPALMPYVLAGFPGRDGFGELLVRVTGAADVVEVGLPFSDPVADGPVIAAAGRRALAGGTTLPWLLAEVAALRGAIAAPLVLMSYLNPLLARGFAATVRAIAAAGFSGLIVPDLPLEEAGEEQERCDAAGVALIQLVTPLTPPDRARTLARASRGFVYAVTRAGITGAATRIAEIGAYLDRLRAVAELPVAAGFGIRAAAQIREIAPHADGVVVGTAVVDLLARGEDPVPFLRSLRPPPPEEDPR
ncbi:MAG: tryptophan synthase subunit alpha [Planctomycetota bacterium]